MAGYVQLCSLSNLKDYLDLNFENKLFIVRAPGKLNYKKYGLIHAPELSPSMDLFLKTKNQWQKGIFNSKEKQILNNYKEVLEPEEIKDDWYILYRFNFVKETLSKPMSSYLESIIAGLELNNNYLLVCFCKDYNLCHRSILGDYFKARGYEVRYN